MDVTPWVEWFLGCLGRAIVGAQDIPAAVLVKAKFWESVSGTSLNARATDSGISPTLTARRGISITLRGELLPPPFLTTEFCMAAYSDRSRRNTNS